MKKIKLTKLSETENPNCKAANKEDFVCGQDNGNISLFNGYEVIGELVHPITIGAPISIDRDSRNGVECFGFMRTSLVQTIDEDLIFTENSIYKVEYL